MNKKMLSAMVTMLAAMVMSLQSFGDTEIVDGIEWTYTITDGEATVGDNDNGGWCCGVSETAVPRSTSGAITIPSTLGKCPVTRIGNRAFWNCSELTGITIPSGIKSIGDGAFVGCNNLSISVAKENANYRLYNGCLMTKDCTMILRGINCDVSIPASVTNIAEYAFYDCDELTSIEIPASVISIGNSAFSDCDGLVDLTISEGVRYIGEYAFDGCENLTSVEIPSSVTSIGEGAFIYCYGLMEVTIADGVEYIGREAFEECTALTSVTIPPSVKEIGIYAFGDCTSLTNVLLCGSMPRCIEVAFASNCGDGMNPNLTIHTTANPLDCIRICGCPLVFDSYSAESLKSKTTVLVVTNVIVHYIQTSELSPMSAPVSTDVGIVNVMTEIVGGNISIPESWTDNYPTFAAKFGANFSDALIRETGKFDAGGKPMMVWQDYVAGTDPTDKDDVFKASVTIVEGVPVISYTPRLSDAEAAKRKYTTWGKVKLQDEKWVEVKSGTEVDYNFFKVTVEMR